MGNIPSLIQQWELPHNLNISSIRLGFQLLIDNMFICICIRIMYVYVHIWYMHMWVFICSMHIWTLELAIKCKYPTSHCRCIYAYVGCIHIYVCDGYIYERFKVICDGFMRPLIGGNLYNSLGPDEHGGQF